MSSKPAANQLTADEPANRRIAVVGSGISGLIAAWILSRNNTVTLFEKDDRLGGHAHTHHLPDGTSVDSGFIVFNERTYPTLIRFFRELGVESQPSDMSMSITCHGCGLSYAGGKGLLGLFPSGTANSRHNLLRPRYLRMLAEIRRFHREAHRLLDSDDTAGTASTPGTVSTPGAAALNSYSTLTEFLREHRFSHYFTNHFLTPLISAVWSCDAATAAQYPARYLFTFLAHHGMLSVKGSPQWRTVRGGSAQYVRKAAVTIADIRLNTQVQSIKDDGVQVTISTVPTLVAATVGAKSARAGESLRQGATVGSRIERDSRTDGDRRGEVSGGDERDWQDAYGAGTEGFDAVVIATHPDQAAALLEANHPARRVLADMPYSRNETVLHRDSTVLPSSPDASASWNYLLPDCDATPEQVLVSYDLSRLQSLGRPEGKPFVVSLGLESSLAPEDVIERMVYEHPQYTPESLHAQEQLSLLNSPRIAFAGAYHGWGFHEDGALSGLRAAEHVGGVWPE